MADLGSAILQGIQSVQDAAARRQQMKLARDELALSQQRTQSALAVDQAQLKKLTDDENRLLRTEATNNLKASGDQIIGAGLREGFFNLADEQKPLNSAAVIAALRDADPLKKATAERFVVDVFNQERRKRRLDSNDYSADDFEFTSLDPEALKQGQIIARGNYKDGRPGVATVDGSSEPTSPVLSLSFDQAAGQMELFAKTGILPFSNMGASDAYTRATVVNRAVNGGAPSGAATSTGRQQSPQSPTQAVNTLLPQIDSAATARLGVSGARDVRSALAEVQNNPAEFGKRVVQIAKTLGIDIPYVLTKRPNDGRRNAGDELGLVEPDKYKPPAGSSGVSPLVVGPLLPAAVLATNNLVPPSNPLIDIEAKIDRKKKAAKNLTGDAAIKAETEIAELEKQRHQLVTDINVRQFQGINSEIDSLTNTRGNVAVERRGEFDKKIAQLKSRREAYIAAGFATPAMRNEAFQELATNVLSRLSNAQPEDVARLVDSGALKFPKRQVTAMTTRAREVGVRSVEDIAKLPNNAERMAMFGMMYAWAGDSNERNQIVTAMRNVAETGVMSMSRDDAIKAQQTWAQIRIAAGNLRVNEARLLLDQAEQREKAAAAAIVSGKDVRGFLTKSSSDFRDYLYGGAALPKDRQGFQETPDRDRVVSAAMFVTTPLLQAAQAAEAQGRDASPFYEEINRQTSAIIAGIGNANNKGWRSLFRDDSSVTASDATLGRVKAVYSPGRNGELKVSGFQYTNASGQNTGTMVTVSQLNNIDPMLSTIAMAAANYGERAANRSANTAVGIPASGPQDPRLRE